MEMTKYKLGDIAEIQTGPFGSQLHNEDYVTEGTPIVTVEHLGNKYFTTQNLPLVSDEDKKRLNRYCLKENDIVFSRVGSVDRCSFVSKNEEGWLFSGRCLRVRPNPKIIEPQWLYYFFTQSHFKEYVRNKAVGCTMPSLNTELLSELGISFPSLKDQKEIASVLSALDDKIALNKKMNQKLETMAKRLYDYWFVQFDFPDKNGRPYKTTGGPMTYNPTLKREIPAGWDVSSFTDFGFFKNGINYDKNEVGDETVKIVNVRNISDSTTYFNIDELDDITLKSDDIQKFVATPKDILLARSGSPGATRLLPQTGKKIIYCGFIIRYQLNEQDLDKQLYLFHVLKGYEQVTSTQSAGSILKNISQDTLNALTVVMPQSSVLDAFNEKIAPIYSMLRKNISELNKLTTLRDKLLPLLMNGQVVVG